MKVNLNRTAQWLELLELRATLSRDEFESARAALAPYPVVRRMLELMVLVVEKPKGSAAHHARLARTGMARVVALAQTYAESGVSMKLLASLLGDRG